MNSLPPSPELRPVFDAPYAPREEDVVRRLIAEVSPDTEARSRVDRHATRLIDGIRGRQSTLGGVEDFL
jgi:RHH-type transcriptional regulator, proline utilization regulon repressor / proline dehydrogenase / delta 1-pyrroline-5-carboxylate dehydrogenase